MSCLLSLIYIVAAIALWRLWPSDHVILWWSILVSTILMYYSAAMVRSAHQEAIGELEPQDEFDFAESYIRVGKQPIVRFWIQANIAITIATLILVTVGLVKSFGRQ
jgi:hypothetical protein